MTGETGRAYGRAVIRRSLHTAAHVGIRASAGSGKTFQLTTRYIALLLAGARPEHILATTFTRKAAGEILQGVLLRLAKGLVDAQQRARLRDVLGRERLTEQELSKALMEVVGKLSRVRISTIDSLFYAICKTFFVELELPTTWTVVDPGMMTALKSEALSRVIRDEEHGALALLRQISGGKFDSHVLAGWVDGIDGWYEMFLGSEAPAWRGLSEYLGPLLLADKSREQIVEELHGLGRRSLSPRACEALEKNLNGVLVGDLDAALGAGILPKVLQGETSYCRRLIPAEILEGLWNLSRYVEQDVRRDLEARAEAWFTLLSRYHNELQRLQYARGEFALSDLGHRLSAHAELFDGLSELFYRLDGQIEHVLLDEFQDTSLGQWGVLRRLAREVGADGSGKRTLFVVGDVKQAIYGWRGGVADIFDALDDDIRGLRWEPLDRSYRSCQPVIDAVNQVFGSLERVSGLAAYRQACGQWAKQFRKHETALDIPGFVNVELVEPTADQKSQEAALDRGAELAARWARQCPGATIALLTRKNDAVRKLIQRLAERGIKASEEGGNPITDSAAVQLILSLMQLADHPADGVARYHVASSPLGAHYGLEDKLESAVPVAQRVRGEVLELGYGVLVQRLAVLLQPLCDEQEARRLSQLVVVANGASNLTRLRPSQFVQYVRQKRVESSGANLVRVMTIHKSKGLQFDIVVLPELGDRLVGQAPPLLVDAESPLKKPSKIVPYVSETLRMVVPQVNGLVQAWKNNQVREALCLLYVAMTRAIHCLQMVVTEGGVSGGAAARFESVIVGTLADASERGEERTVLYASGDAAWYERVERVKQRAQALPQPEALQKLRFADAEKGPRVLERQAPSLLHSLSLQQAGELVGDGADAIGGDDGAGVPLRELLRMDAGGAQQGAKLFGQVIHALFEQVTWLEEGLPDGKELEAAALAAGASARDVGEVIEQFRRYLQEPQTRAVLLRSGYEQGGLRARVYRELRFAVTRGDRLIVGIIDRVVVCDKQGRNEQVHVLDFKTDRVDGQQVDERARCYREQVQTYCYAASKLFGVDRQSVTGALAFVASGRVVTGIGEEEAGK